MQVPAHNPTPGPVLVTDDGATLGGGEWGLVDGDLELVQDAVDNQRLIIFPQGLPDDADPEILAQVYPTPDVEHDADDASAAPAPDDEDAPKIPPAKGTTRKATR